MPNEDQLVTVPKLHFMTQSVDELAILDDAFTLVTSECHLPVSIFRDSGFELVFVAYNVQTKYLERIVIPRYKSVMEKHNVGGSVRVTCNNVAQASREGLVDCWFNVNLVQKYWEFEEKWEVPF